MAKITLQPNEQFEYFHIEESIIKLIKGELAYGKLNLKAGELIITPAKNIHTLRNIGKVSATIHLYRVECLTNS